MTTRWILMAVFALTRQAVAADAHVTVYLVEDGTAMTFWARTIASSVFHRAGIVIDWRKSGEPGDALPSRCLRVEIAEETPGEVLPGALGVSYPYSGCRKGVTIFHDRIRRRAGTPSLRSALLAYVLAHEIAHVLERVDRHSDAGVMKAHWDATDREAIFARRLSFDARDVRLMQRGIADGLCKDAGVIAPSGSETVSRPE
jgi:hypothetical protein